jgi:hypothetical protein
MLDPESKQWLDYIGKLNDRALQRQRASGLTTWAICGIIAWLATKVLAKIDVLTTNVDARSLHFLTTTVTVDLVFFGLMLLIFLPVTDGPSTEETRLQSKLSRLSNIAMRVPLLLLCVLIFGLNLYCVHLAPRYGFFTWNFWPIATFVSLTVILLSYGPVSTYFKKRKQHDELPELSSILPRSNASRGVRIFISLGGFSVSLFTALKAIPNINTPLDVDTVMWSFCSTGLVFLSLYLWFRYTSRHEGFFRQLERRIVLDELCADEIRSIFIKEYLGETLRDWIIKAENEMNRINDKFDSLVSDMENRLKDVSDLDPKLQYEIAGRRLEICNSLNAALGEYSNYNQKLSGQVLHLANQVPEGDLALLAQLVKVWGKKVPAMGARRIEFCTACENGWIKQIEACNQPIEAILTSGSEQSGSAPEFDPHSS